MNFTPITHDLPDILSEQAADEIIAEIMGDSNGISI